MSNKMEETQPKFTMPSPGPADALKIARMFEKIKKGLKEYQERHEGGPTRRVARADARATHEANNKSAPEKAPLFRSQLATPPAVFPSSDERAARDEPGPVGGIGARVTVAESKAKFPSEDSGRIVDDLRGDRSDPAKPDVIPSACGMNEPQLRFESSGATRGSFGDVKPPQKPSSKPLAFNQPTFGEDFFAKNRATQLSETDGKPKSGQGVCGDLRSSFNWAGPPPEPRFKPLVFDKPTFGEDFFSQHRVTTGKRRGRDEGASTTVASSSMPCGSTGVASSSTPCQNRNVNYRGFGFGFGFGFHQPSKEEIDDFIAFADKIIPSIKRRKIEGGHEKSEEKGK